MLSHFVIWFLHLSKQCMDTFSVYYPLRNKCVINDHGYVVVSICGPFPHAWLSTEFVTSVTRRVPLVEQELLTLPEHLSSPLIVSRVRAVWSLVFCVVFCRSLFVLFLLPMVLSVFHWFTASDYPFGIFKHFWHI